jgi:hypothetical protein
LVAVELEACDTNPSGNVTLVLFRVGKLENPPFVPADDGGNVGDSGVHDRDR